MGLEIVLQNTTAGFPWLSAVTWLPAVGAVLLMAIPRENTSLLKGMAFGWSLAVFGLSLGLLAGFDGSSGDFQLVENVPWIEGLGIRYALGIDGISLFLVLLSTFIVPVIVLGSWNAVEKRVKEFLICFLFLETAMVGALVALDIFLFYLFWELMLIPMYLLIGVWGGANRIQATLKFFLYTAVGSLLMLAAIFYLYHARPETTGPSFLISDYYGLRLTLKEQLFLFGAFAVAFAVKVPLFPFHTWLPRAHVEAPTAGSVVLAGVLLKMGTYGFVRFAMPLFPDAVKIMTPYIAGLSVIGIVYGALLALAQGDVKKLVAYSSVSHLGFVMLGLAALTPQGVEGGLLQMINHGISTGALFLLVGVIYERRHTRNIADFGGLARVMPAFAVLFMIVTLSSIGLPGTNGFVGEFLVLMGAFTADGYYDLRWYVAVGATGVILGAFYMLWMFQRVMFGPRNPKNEGLPDLSRREWATLAPLIVLIFALGIFPNLVLDKVHASVERAIQLSTATVLPPGDADGRATIEALEKRKKERAAERAGAERAEVGR